MPPAPPAEAPRPWRIVDPVLRLRALQTDALYPLPEPAPGTELVVGAGAAATLRLRDPTGRLSRRHALLFYADGRWTIRDLASKNGLWIDGARARAAALAPGLELGLGGLTLLAESAGLVRLRALLARLLGWRDARAREIDRALRGLRYAAQLHAALVLCGEGDLVPIARRLHRETLGAAPPFVACPPGAPALPLLPAAAGGTLCFSAEDPPADLLDLLAAVRTADARPGLVMCAPDAPTASPAGILLGPTVWIELPPLEARGDELARVVVEAAEDAADELDQPFTAVRADDLARLARAPFLGLADLHDAVRRLVALRALGPAAAAAHLGLEGGALARWARRRGLSADPG